MIYQCIPESVERLWGSLPPESPGKEPVGEIWWFHSGTMLRAQSGDLLPASALFCPEAFPVILKTLHSACDLSVQVHPGKNRRPPMKDESWVILEGSGRILHGIAAGTDPNSFSRAVRDGKVESLLLSESASPGDLFHLPAGTVHALGGGLTVLEIQLSCSVTYRLWDYARKDVNGNLRELHVEQGLEAIDWSRNGKALPILHSEQLDTPDYSIRKAAPGIISMQKNELAYDHLSGKCFFSSRQGEEIETAGETWIVRIHNVS